jgi:hypothetical protein
MGTANIYMHTSGGTTKVGVSGSVGMRTLSMPIHHRIFLGMKKCNTFPVPRTIALRICTRHDFQLTAQGQYAPPPIIPSSGANKHLSLQGRIQQPLL